MTDDPLAAMDAAILSIERDEAEFAVITVDAARNWYTQVVVTRRGSERGLHGEVVGNEFLAPPDQLSDDVVDRLIATGWNRPEDGPGGMLWRQWSDWTGVHRRLVVDDLWQAMLTAFNVSPASRLEVEINS